MNLSAISFYQYAEDETLSTAWSKAISFSKTDPNTFSSDFTTLFDKMNSSPFVYIGGQTAMTAKVHNSCDIIFLEDNNLPYQSLAVGVQKGSPLLDMFSQR